MDALAQALVGFAARIELAVEADVDPLFAREVMEELGRVIDEACPAEREALLRAARALRERTEGVRGEEETAAFAARFGEVFGLAG